MSRQIRRVGRRRVVAGESPARDASGAVDGSPTAADVTRDDTDEGWGEPAPDEQGPRDAWLRAQRPPHWE